MTPLDLFEAFEGTAAKIGLVASYEFDPIFFERRVLRKTGFARADKILVLMDAGRYADLLSGTLPASGFNRRYLVVPIERRPYAFHPKLYLLAGERRVVGIVGSSNCTGAGLAHNMELCSVFSAAAPEKSLSDAQAMLGQIFRTIGSFATEAPHLKDIVEREFFAPLRERHGWLAESEEKGTIELLHSHETPLWPEVTARLRGKNVKRVGIVSPFYDRDLTLIKLLRTTWPEAALSIYAQPKYATLEGTKLSAVFGKKDRLFAVTPPTGRRLHAKLFAFETSKETFWLTGSPNATLDALKGGNTETALWFSTEDGIGTLLADDALTIGAIDPKTFEAGVVDERDEEDTVAKPLVLQAASLDGERTIHLQFDASAKVQALTVRITNFGEQHPFLSLPLARSSHTIQLTEDQAVQIRRAALCQLKGLFEGREITSDRAALVQLHELLKERDGDTRNSDRKRKISETGEELVSHLDTLGTVREAVEFLDHASIRFEDGEEASRRGNQPSWKPRDPFVSDIPAQWLSAPFANTADDLKEAVWRFVTRHQHEKLEKHVRRGNLNGLPNFLDIFRTLNALLVAFNGRKPNGVPIVPYPYVVLGIRTNIDLLIGAYDEEGEYVPGYVDAVNANIRGDWQIARDRFLIERVPEMLAAATEAMIAARRAGLVKPPPNDTWPSRQRQRLFAWFVKQGLPAPRPEEAKRAAQEYLPLPIAA
jgi:hypothetical protein